MALQQSFKWLRDIHCMGNSVYSVTSLLMRTDSDSGFLTSLQNNDVTDNVSIWIPRDTDVRISMELIPRNELFGLKDLISIERMTEGSKGGPGHPTDNTYYYRHYSPSTFNSIAASSW